MAARRGWEPEEITWGSGTATYGYEERVEAKRIMAELPEDEARAVLGFVHEAKVIDSGARLLPRDT